MLATRESGSHPHHRERKIYAAPIVVKLQVFHVQGLGIEGGLLGPLAVLLRDATSKHFAVVKGQDASAIRAVATALANAGRETDAPRGGPIAERVVLSSTDGSGDAYVESRDGDHLVRRPCPIIDGIAVATRLGLPIEVDEAAWKPGPTRVYQIHHSREVAFDLVPPRLAIPRPAPREVVEWLCDHAVPLASYGPGHSTGDLHPLDDLVRAARVVAVGEATHATSEFTQMWHRLIEYLVTKHEFSLVGWEAPFTDSLGADAFVKTGAGDADAATRALFFDNYFTVETRELMKWMRRHNSAKRGRALGFYGVDMQSLKGPNDRVVAYLEEVDPEYLALARRERATFASVVDQLVATKRDYIERSSEDAWRWAHFTAKIAGQAQQEQQEDEEISLWRDACMAENVVSLLELQEPGAKMVLCAHNRHISRESGPDGEGGWMGWHLAQILGTEYVNIALIFNEGTFRSQVGEDVREYFVGPAPEGTLESAFAKAEFDIAFLDLRDIENDTPVGEWMSTAPPTRQLGWGYSYEDEMNQFTARDPRELHDALIYIRTSSAPTPI